MRALDLQSQLDEITANTRDLVQPERLAATDAAIQDLFATGIEDRILQAGAQAPSFTLNDAVTGKLVRSDDLLALGRVVLKIFRGRWCPYCMTELEAWQALYPQARESGALLVALSPQTRRQNDFAAQQHRLTFPLLSDPGASVAEKFGVTYLLPKPMQDHYRSILVNIPFINSESSWRLPLPATFVIAQDRSILFSEAHADHRVRPDPQDVLTALQT